MKEIVLDLETTVEFVEDIDEETGKIKKVIDNSPFNPNNKIVTAHWLFIDDGIISKPNHSVFYHNDYPVPDSREALEAALAEADCIVGQNIKYDIMYLLEAGFSVPTLVRDIMLGEYILDRGVGQVSFSLEATAERRNVPNKKLDITKEYFKNGIGYEAIPLPIVLEYGDGDVLATADIYLQQVDDFKKPENITLNNIVILMNEMLNFVVEIERNGIKIDVAELARIKQDYLEEREQLEKDLIAIARNVMGDEPFNLSSGPDISKIVYSREVIDKHKHKEIFNLGTDANGKKLYPPYMTDNAFKVAVRTTTKIAKQKYAQHCTVCHGTGMIRKTKKNGSFYKNENKCNVCDGAGYTLHDGDKIAGLRLIPERPADASVHGFSVSKTEIGRLIAQAQQSGKLTAVEFLQKKQRLNAVNTYINSFVIGIERWTRADNILHAGFNQAITATGRLSSSRPNFQNQPKERKFPIRRCVISRFENGSITECDFSGLEFVVAGELSRDPQIIEDILNGKDIHRQTASIVHRKPKEEITKDERNEVKPYTFAPLYGGQGANEPEHIRTYFKEFFNIYKRHGEWQTEQMDSVITTGVVRTPSGREYSFPGTRRLKGGRTTNSTQIVNYPVQGFATGDIVPLACIRAYRELEARGLRSCLILTVHDSIVVDTHPDEKEEVFEILKWATTGVVEEAKERWGYEFVLPLKSETSNGPNWMEMVAIHV